jgi:8-oxo-dGTP pyrophosphatase MutT (NUDIX family)
MKKTASGGEPSCRVQYGALPFRREEDGSLRVLLVTSRETKRWVIPKGWPVKGLKPWSAAAREAYEEAGLVGEVERRAIGCYLYDKRLKNRDVVGCAVEVFPFAVRKRLKRWPEKGERDSRWFTIEEAAEAVVETGLSALIRGFGSRAEAVSSAA